MHRLSVLVQYGDPDRNDVWIHFSGCVPADMAQAITQILADRHYKRPYQWLAKRVEIDDSITFLDCQDLDRLARLKSQADQHGIEALEAALNLADFDQEFAEELLQGYVGEYDSLKKLIDAAKPGWCYQKLADGAYHLFKG